MLLLLALGFRFLWPMIEGIQKLTAREGSVHPYIGFPFPPAPCGFSYTKLTWQVLGKIVVVG